MGTSRASSEEVIVSSKSFTRSMPTGLARPIPVPTRDEFTSVPHILLNDDAFRQYIDSKPQERPETLREFLAQHLLAQEEPQKVWRKPSDEVMRKVFYKKKKKRVDREISQIKDLPPLSELIHKAPDKEVPAFTRSDSQLDDSDLQANDEEEESAEPRKTPEKGEFITVDTIEEEDDDHHHFSYWSPRVLPKTKWTDAYYVPKTRMPYWPGIRMPPEGERLKRSDFLQRLQLIRTSPHYHELYLLTEHVFKQEFNEGDEQKARKREELLKKEKEEEAVRALKIDRSPLKGCLAKLHDLRPEADLPIDIPVIDTFCRPPVVDIKTLPAQVQREEKATRAFQRYLDESGVSELLIGTLYMIFSNPGLPENAKELLRLGLGGKPMETANVSEALREIDETKARISSLESEMFDLRQKLLRALKEKELPDYPINPNKTDGKMRRMDYVLKGMDLITRPSDVPMDQIYDLPEEIGLIKKFSIPHEGYNDDGVKEIIIDREPPFKDVAVNTK